MLMSIDQIKASFKELPVKDREKLLVELQQMEAKESDVHFSRREWLNNKLGCCPHCQSNKYRKHGIDKGSQRYMCTSCRRSFTEYTGTWMDGLHKKELVSEYIKLMEQELSLDKITSRLSINKKTAFDWRHKILSGLQRNEKDPFEGITESDDTFFRFSEKGARKLTRKPNKRGGSIRGIGSDQVSVIVTADRANRTDFKVTRRGRMKKIDIEDAIGTRVTEKTILCTDSNVSYKGFAIDRQLEHHPLRSDLKQRVVKGIYHIQHVNAIDSRLKRWISGRFIGVSTKYLQKYLNWFRTKEKLSSSTNYVREFAERALHDTATIEIFKNIPAEFEKICIYQR